MPEHFTKNTLEVTAYCPQCKQNTQHRVDGGRRGPCIDANHGNPFRTIPGERQFRVIWLDLKNDIKRHQDFERFEEALRFFSSKGRDIATLWQTSYTPNKKLR
jgi:hypothetical protein